MRAGLPIQLNFVRLEIRLRQLEQRRQHEAAGDEAPGGAVLRRDALDVGRGLDAAGARHVRDHDVGIARNVFLDDRRQRHRIGAHRAAAGAGADIHRDGLAAVELLDRLGRAECAGRRCSEQRTERTRACSQLALTYLTEGLKRRSHAMPRCAICASFERYLRSSSAEPDYRRALPSASIVTP